MKKPLLSICILISAFANAQITITSADMPQADDTYYSAQDSTVTSVGSSGPNQIWNFSNWLNQGIDTNSFVNPSTLAGSSSFPSANLGLIMSDGDIFINNNSSSFDILGIYVDFGNGPTPLQFTPAQKFLAFPCSYQGTYNGVTKLEFAMPYPQPPADSIKQVSYNNYSSVIDAWGTVSTPTYSGVNALRQKYTEIKTDSVFIHIGNTWTFAQASVDTTISHRWWSDAEKFPVAEIQTDGSGNVTSANYIVPPPQVSFTANPTSGCAPLTVNFTNTSTVNAFTYYWDFGDGTSYIGTDTSHTYQGGNYWMGMAALDSAFNIIGTAYTIIFVGGSAGYFDMNTDSVCPSDEIYFEAQDGAFDYVWNFGDGSTESGQQWVSHSYASVGTYTVKLIVTTSCGTDTIQQSVYVGTNVFPEDNISIWPWQVCPNQPVNFYSDASGSDYQWTFGDGNSGNGQYTTHSYSSIGNYNVSLLITNSCANSTTANGMVSVTNNLSVPPDADLFNWPPSACPGTEIYFSAPSDYASYVWDYGDGSPLDTTAENELTHSFDSFGVYTVSVTITNFCGNDTTVSTTVDINNSAPFNGWVDMNINPEPACPGSSVLFQAWSSDAVSYEWNFGDGNTSSNQSDTHVYQNTGTYNVTLTLTNSCGSDTLLNTTVSINNNVIPDPNDYDYGVAADTMCPGDSILFYIAPSGSGTYLWNFGDGSSTTSFYTITEDGYSIDLAPHVYAALGTYNATFTLTNLCGNSFTDNITVVIGNNSPVDGDMWVNDDTLCQGEEIEFEALGGATYVWNFGDGSAADTTVGTVTEALHTYSFSGEYTVTVNITNSCGNSAVYADTITVDSCAVVPGINEFEDFGFRIFPNPSDGKFKIQNSKPIAIGFKIQNIEIYNLLGEKLLSLPSFDGEGWERAVDISNQPQGIYFVRVNADEKVYCIKIVVE